jgi:RND family efflux transporter, MFP subunit
MLIHAHPFLTRWTQVSLAFLGIIAGIGGCTEEVPGPQAAPPTEVTAVTVTARDIPATYDFVGKTESTRKVEIRARVQGFLNKRSYEEGEIVKAGQTLFLMDRKPFEAKLKVAKAALGQQEARLRTARANLNRVRPLAAENAVSQKDLDDAIGQEQAAAAAVEAAKAEVIGTDLDLGYTTIRSPLQELASYAVVTEGTYVDFSNSLLTNVSVLSPMRVNFSVSENQILKVRDEAALGQLRRPERADYEVEIVLADGSVFPEKGRITFADVEFSETTGTYLVRAEIPNLDASLRPGQFVRARVLGAVRPGAIVVPKRAVLQTAQGSMVFVISKDGTAEPRPLTLGDWYEEDWIVTQGLRGGETVAVDGAIKLRPGAPVKVVEAGPATGPAEKVGSDEGPVATAKP